MKCKIMPMMAPIAMTPMVSILNLISRKRDIVALKMLLILRFSMDSKSPWGFVQRAIIVSDIAARAINDTIAGRSPLRMFWIKLKLLFLKK